VPPATLQSEPQKTRTRSCQKASPTVAWRSGIAPTVSALIRSAMMLERRWPSRSTIAPPKKEARIAGTSSQKATIPVRAALPVVSSTNQGIATAVSCVPPCDIA
jgi:hypothetical protein